MSDLQAPPRPTAGDRRRGPVGLLVGQLRETHVQLLASQVLNGLIALVANVLMARALSPTGRGEVALLLQVVYLATQVLLLGTERSFMAAYHGVAPAAAVRAYLRLLIVPTAVTVAAAAAFAAIAPAHYNPGPGIIALIAVYAVTEAVILGTRAVAVVTHRMAGYLYARFADSGLLLVFLVLLFAGNVTQPVWWVLAYLFSSMAPTVVQIVRWLRLPAPAGATPITPGQNRLVRREGLSLFPAALSNMAMLRVDRLALPALASTAALGLYTTVGTLTELLAWPIRAYADARLGHWRAAHRAGTLRTRPLIAGAVLYALVVTPIVAAGLYLLIVPVFGARYADAKVVVVPLVVAAGLYSISRVCLGLLIARGYAALVSTSEIVGFAASFTGYLLLIPPLGILGAAYGSLIGYGTSMIFALVATLFVGAPAALDAPQTEPVS
ncbi:MAG: lipopolysaccharide biosynthesis protein [Catenulispora sp.]